MRDLANATERTSRWDRGPHVKAIGYICVLINVLLFTLPNRIFAERIIETALFVIHVGAIVTLLIGMAYYYVQVVLLVNSLRPLCV